MINGDFADAQRRWDEMEDMDNKTFCIFCDDERKEDHCENKNCSDYEER